MRKVDENQLHQYYALEVIILVYTEHTILKVHYFSDSVDILKSSSCTHYMIKSCLFTKVLFSLHPLDCVGPWFPWVPIGYDWATSQYVWRSHES